MSVDTRGVSIEHGDAVVWFGRLGRTRPALHIGLVVGYGFWGKVRVGLARHGEDDGGYWISTGVTVSVRPRDMLVIDDCPESPYE
jgi:hypothetical protein